ncbi:MAG: tRNA pseudouridine(13) synthase TruD [Candidatus Woesearchaeota archaeon]
MYKLKTQPSDFVVTEHIPACVNEGEYMLYILQKENMNTLQAIEILAKYLRIHKKHIGFCGIKDKHAITRQYITIRSSKTITPLSIDRLQLPFRLEFVQYCAKPLYVGALERNSFHIRVRSAKEYTIIQKDEIINYFGEQRFSTQNDLVGEYLVKKDWKNAVDILCDDTISSKYITQIQQYLHTHPNDFIGAIRLVPKNLLELFTHAYQSRLWNTCAQIFTTKYPHKQTRIPIIGFDTELDEYSDAVQEIITDILSKEDLTLRSFIQKSIPELTLAGASRKVFVKLLDKSFEDLGDEKILKFTLPKGSYATVAVNQLLKKAQ